MKKLICMLMTLVILSGASFAQDKMDRKEKPGAGKHQPHKVDGKKAPKMKKDGTPDKRYKENKDHKDPAGKGKMRKDGKPDMRHKANKDAGKK